MGCFGDFLGGIVGNRKEFLKRGGVFIRRTALAQLVVRDKARVANAVHFELKILPHGGQKPAQGVFGRHLAR